ncbi:hypothetical protein, partial [Thalassospira profundimaris]|uniref:hypothetical protein n=1 Tax=Thalassospira profundimaris TaxID=502049 RepID=UPI001C69174F
MSREKKSQESVFENKRLMRAIFLHECGSSERNGPIDRLVITLCLCICAMLSARHHVGLSECWAIFGSKSRQERVTGSKKRRPEGRLFERFDLTRITGAD